MTVIDFPGRPAIEEPSFPQRLRDYADRLDIEQPGLTPSAAYAETPLPGLLEELRLGFDDAFEHARRQDDMVAHGHLVSIAAATAEILNRLARGGDR